jgi:polyisoprenoid-binding protein YceI
MRLSIAVSCLLLALGSAAAGAAPIDPARSQIKFGFKQMGVAGDGEFHKVSGDITFDPAKPDAGQAKLTIDLAGVDAGSPETNDLLKSKDWFDAAQFPSATFASTSFKASGAGAFQVTGQFTLKGKSAALVVPFTTRSDAAGLWLEGSVPLSRLAYKVGEGDWADVSTVTDSVQIRFKLLVPRK